MITLITAGLVHLDLCAIETIAVLIANKFKGITMIFLNFLYIVLNVILCILKIEVIIVCLKKKSLMHLYFFLILSLKKNFKKMLTYFLRLSYVIYLI